MQKRIKRRRCAHVLHAHTAPVGLATQHVSLMMTMMFDTCVTLQQSFTTWRRACTTELLICSVAGRRGCLPCRPERNLKTVKDDAVQDRAQPSFSAVFQCSPSVSAPVLSVQPSFSAACFQCSLLSIQPSFSAAFQCSPSFSAAFQCSPSVSAPVPVSYTHLRAHET